jgi:hypothetical protein
MRNLSASPEEIFSTALTIDESELTSETAAVPVVISQTAILNDAEIHIDVDSIDSTARGLIVTLIGFKA